jgi:isopentenyl diphosphate isomerase/L-lactate dehydrogenase-like FMN-dependent dehydrogenase
MCLSTLATTSCEEVMKETPKGIKFYQLYITKNRQHTIDLVKRVEKLGYKALCVTVDTPELGNREPDHHNEFVLPSHLNFPNLPILGKKFIIILK